MLDLGVPDTTPEVLAPRGYPRLSVIRSLTPKGASTDSLNRVCSGTSPGDYLFHEPEAHPKTVTAGTPPEATLRGHQLNTSRHPQSYKPVMRWPR